MNLIHLWHRLRRSIRVACCLLALAAGSTGAEETPGSPAQETLPENGVALGEIVVQAPEPKFVAPTRRDRIGRIWAPVVIDGKGPYRLVLDTGANHSAVTERTARSLGTPTAIETLALVNGFTGSAMVPTISVTSIDIGAFALGPANLPVLADVFGGAEGVLSVSDLHNERIFADFAHDRLEIAPSQRARAPAGFAVVPLHMSGGLPMADILVGGVRTRAIIDTGAQSSVGNLALRRALARQTPRKAAREDIIGVTLQAQSGDSLSAPDIQLGHLTIHGMTIVFGDMYLFQHWHLTREPTLTIGMDLLGSFDVMIIDYARREMQLQLRARAAPP